MNLQKVKLINNPYQTNQMGNFMKKIFVPIFMALCILCLSAVASAQTMEDKKMNAEKLPMTDSGIVRLSKIEVYPEHLEEYLIFAAEVGTISLQEEAGVLTMYAVAEKDNPCIITILETYASEEAYKAHIASAHFQKYKTGTIHMVKNLQLIDQQPLNPHNVLKNFIMD